MKRQKTGYYQEDTSSGRSLQAFIPYPLPPDPPVRIEGSLMQSMGQALLSLGRLDGLTEYLPRTGGLLLYSFSRREALLSSQVEGFQSSLTQLLLFENKAPTPLEDVDDRSEIKNYVIALERGLELIRSGMPLSNRLFWELHAILLKSGRGSKRKPGEFRRSMVWIGSGATPADISFVPPPHLEVPACMAALEEFLNTEDDGLPPLVRIALAHVQFETIHPFYDGNGRLGRLLIILFLCKAGVLQKPLLYLSLYMKKNRAEYYALLNQTHTEGDWEAWLEFFFAAVRETAEDALSMAKSLRDLFESDQKRIEGSGRRAGSALRVQEALREQPVASTPDISRRTGLSSPTVVKSLQLLTQLEIVEELTGQSRNRIFAYRECLAILEKDAEPL